MALSLWLLGYAVRPPPARKEEPPARRPQSQRRPRRAAQIIPGCPQPVLGQDGNTGQFISLHMKAPCSNSC